MDVRQGPDELGGHEFEFRQPGLTFFAAGSIFIKIIQNLCQD
jgi:hypothetical protein